MNDEELRVRADITKALAFASGFDQRKPSRAAVEAWACIPEIAAASYQQLEAVIIAHHRGPNRHEYLSVAHIVDALQVVERNSLYEIEADVRSAKARGLITSDWPTRRPLPDDTQHQLATIRERENRQANAHLELDFLEPNPVDVGHVGRRVE